MARVVIACMHEAMAMPRDTRGRSKQKIATLRKMLDLTGANLTRQRACVFDYLSRVSHHPTAEEVFLAVKQEMPRIGLATVYKNLESLVTCGAASKLSYGDSAARYDIRTDHHYHTRCLKCGRIADVDPASRDYMSVIKTPNGFKVEEVRVELVGYCKNCK
jgi:Fe2+ or Zn2+ uptake regulation protein